MKYRESRVQKPILQIVEERTGAISQFLDHCLRWQRVNEHRGRLDELKMGSALAISPAGGGQE
jgi:hypothetical protein